MEWFHQEAKLAMSDWKKVTAYATAWSFSKNAGVLRLVAEGGAKADVELDSAAELAAIADLLRHEDDAFFDLTDKVLRTGFEIPGDIV